MSRVNVLTQEECFDALFADYILENEHGYRVWLDGFSQIITNKKRCKRKKGKCDYKFDYPTWRIVGRLPLWKRILNNIKRMF